MAPPSTLLAPEIGVDVRQVGGSRPNPHNPLIGFAAGVLSGWTKLVVGHPFDTIKTRLQCTPEGTYRGAWHCLAETVKKEGPRALYNGASLPAISFGVTDAVLMGSLHNYRAFLASQGLLDQAPGSEVERLSVLGHALAGLFAGWTNACISHPPELIKCKLQLQLTLPDHVPRQFSGPFDVMRQTYRVQGSMGMWKGLGAGFLVRSCFAVMFGGFEVFNRLFKSWDGTTWAMSIPAANFWAGAMASNLYWLTALPFDNVKNRILTDSITKPRYSGVIQGFRQTWMETLDPRRSFAWNSRAWIRTFYRGWVPVFLRATPTNAAALAVWEGVLRWSAGK